ncbi:hypothetical protein OBG91_13055 [Lactococcus lactis]|nr:hypothetical protein [Lactococcus lactis]
MTGKELLEIIIVKIENLGIELKYEKLNGASAYISYRYGWGIIDIKRATAFEICHEYIHAKNKDIIRHSDNDWDNPCEKLLIEKRFFFYGISLRKMLERLKI